VKQHFGRFFIAGFISLTSLLLVSTWYFFTAPKSKVDKSLTPIAIVKQIKEEVDRRPAKRQVWQAIANGEVVYSGEAIRTAKGSEVKVQFLDGSRSIDIEPESIVMIIQSANKEFSLDLMEGGASVVADKADAGNINLIQNGKTVAIKGAATLSKSGSGGLEIQSDEISAGGNPFFLMMSDMRLKNFKLLQPQKDKNIFVDKDQKSVDVSWSGIPTKVKTKIALGTERNNLNQIFFTDTSAISLNLLSGFYFYKLYFLDPTTDQILAESKLQRLKVNERKFPVFVSPSANQFITIVNQSADPKYKMLFDWTTGDFVNKYIIEVATDNSLRKKIFTKTFSKKSAFEFDLSPGEYYYRISAQFETESEIKVGKIDKFTVSLNKKIDPTTIGLNLIQWGQDPDLQYYISQPELAMNWKTDLGKKISEFRIKLINVDDPLAPAQEIRSEKIGLKTKVFKPGRYIASIQGVDEGENVVANSQKREFTVKELDMVKPPQIIGDQILQANRDGNLTVKWNLASGAYKYKYRLIDELGQQVQGQLLDSATIDNVILKDLMPGVYLIELAGVDMLGRTGQVATRKIDVPAMSSLGAPKLKKLKVK
jgi:hypothetical protein